MVSFDLMIDVISSILGLPFILLMVFVYKQDKKLFGNFCYPTDQMSVLRSRVVFFRRSVGVLLILTFLPGLVTIILSVFALNHLFDELDRIPYATKLYAILWPCIPIGLGIAILTYVTVVLFALLQIWFTKSN